MSTVGLKLSKPLVSWWLVVSFVLPIAFFSETIILLEEVAESSSTWLMPIWWIALWGVVFFLGGIFISWLHRTAGLAALVIVAVFSLFFLKFEYIPHFVGLSSAVKLACALVVVAVGFVVVRRLKILERAPSPVLVLATITVFVGIPAASTKWFSHEQSTQRISSRALQACYAAYVDRYSDLRAAYAARPRGLSKAQWGESHYKKFGKASKRRLPGNCGHLHFPATLATDAEYLEFFESLEGIEFRERPNIYLIVFDALIPKMVSELFFGEGSAAHYNALERNFLMPQGVTMQDYIPSKPSLRSVMWLDTMAPTALWAKTKHGEFSGWADSPFARLFRSNGYQITTGFFREFWPQKGKFIDRWVTLGPAFENTMLCFESEESLIEKLKGFGICSLLGEYSSFPSPQKLISGFFTNSLNEAPYERWKRQVLGYLEENSPSADPKIKFLYVFDPIGHTPKGFSFKDPALRKYREYFLAKSKEAEAYLNQIVGRLERADPEAILLVAGDHGALMSIGSKDRGFATVDKRAVAIALWKSQHPCVDTINREGFTPNSEGYHTISTAIRSVLSCLAKDPAQVDRLPIVARFPKEEIGSSWEEFLSRNINDDIRAILNNSMSN